MSNIKTFTIFNMGTWYRYYVNITKFHLQYIKRLFLFSSSRIMSISVITTLLSIKKINMFLKKVMPLFQRIVPYPPPHTLPQLQITMDNGVQINFLLKKIAFSENMIYFLII